MKTIAIIGGGASGLAAAAEASRLLQQEEIEAEVVIYEAADRIGKSILATGNGRCNLSNINIGNEHAEGVCSASREYNNAGFVAKAFAAMPPSQVRNTLFEYGLHMRVEAEGRLYPLSNKASSVVDVFRFTLAEQDVRVECDHAVEAIKRKGDRYCIRFVGDAPAMYADAVIVACGGRAISRIAIPGPKCLPLRPVLGPLKTFTDNIKSLNNIRVKCEITLLHGGFSELSAGRVACGADALRAARDSGFGCLFDDASAEDARAQNTEATHAAADNYGEEAVDEKSISAGCTNVVEVDARRINASCSNVRDVDVIQSKLFPHHRVEAVERGELLFRDYGVSGIAVFNMSRLTRSGDVLLINFFPAESASACVGIGGAAVKDAVANADSCMRQEATALRAADVARYLQMHAQRFPNRPILEHLAGMVPTPVARVVCAEAGLDPKAPFTCASADDSDIQRLALVLTAFPLVVDEVADAKQCQVMRGGLGTEHFNPTTMESRSCEGLYVAGEALDVDGPCGGYNLHWAWTSGFLAGAAAVERLVQMNVSEDAVMRKGGSKDSTKSPSSCKFPKG